MRPVCKDLSTKRLQTLVISMPLCLLVGYGVAAKSLIKHNIAFAMGRLHRLNAQEGWCNRRVRHETAHHTLFPASRPRNRRGCGWVACRRLGITPRTTGSASSTAKRRSCARSFAVMPNSARCGC